MMSERTPVIFAVVILVLLLVSCGGSLPSQETTLSGATILEERCTACHNLDRVTRAQKNHDEWTQTVTRMVGKGAQLSGDEQALLVDYLVETYGP